MTYIFVQLDATWGLVRYRQNANCEPVKQSGSYLEDLLSVEDMPEISL